MRSPLTTPAVPTFVSHALSAEATNGITAAAATTAATRRTLTAIGSPGDEVAVHRLSRRRWVGRSGGVDDGSCIPDEAEQPNHAGSAPTCARTSAHQASSGMSRNGSPPNAAATNLPSWPTVPLGRGTDSVDTACLYSDRS